MRATGTVVRWDEAKGYGFVRPDFKEKGDKDVFVHHTGIEANGPGRRNLEEGARVQFEIEPTEKGPQAVSVVTL